MICIAHKKYSIASASLESSLISDPSSSKESSLVLLSDSSEQKDSNLVDTSGSNKPSFASSSPKNIFRESWQSIIQRADTRQQILIVVKSPFRRSMEENDLKECRVNFTKHMCQNMKQTCVTSLRRLCHDILTNNVSIFLRYLAHTNFILYQIFNWRTK